MANTENKLWSYLSNHAEEINNLMKSEEIPDFKKLIVYENTKAEEFDRYYTLTGAFISEDAFGPTRVDRTSNCFSDLLDVDAVAEVIASLPEEGLTALKVRDLFLVTLLLYNNRFYGIEKQVQEAMSSYMTVTASDKREDSERCQSLIERLTVLKDEYADLEKKTNDLFDIIENLPTFHTRNAAFIYGNKVFVGTDIKLTGSFREMADQTKWVFNSGNEKAFTFDGGWTHEEFYKAAGKENAATDIFECLDDGKLYVPGSNTLFLWMGQEKGKKK